MRIRQYSLHLLLAFVLAVSLAACDQSSQNFDFEAGNSLTINGPASVAVPDTAEYYVRAFTINKNYSWSVSGAAEIIQTRRDGEYIDVAFTEAGTFTVEVDDGEYTGAIEVTAEP